MLESTLVGQTLLFVFRTEVLASSFLALFGYYIISCLRSPLAKLPGTWYSVVSPVQEVVTILTGPPGAHIDLHRKYGHVVRITPNAVSVVGPDLLKTVYGSHRFRKAPIYEKFASIHDTMFATQRVEFHKQMKRQLAPAYSQNSILAMEPDVRKVGIDKAYARLEKSAASNGVIDLIPLMQHMTVDIISEVALGGSLNTIDDDNHPFQKWSEQGAMLAVFRAFLPGFSILQSLGVFNKYIRGRGKMMDAARGALKRRSESPHKHQDVLQAIMDATDEKGEKLTELALIAETLVQLAAGSDTTSLTIAWGFHLLMENPRCMKKLADELCTAFPDINSLKDVTHENLVNLPYLNAVINETLRYRPAIYGGLPRVVPEGGETLEGHFLPGGTVVYAEAWISHHLEEFWTEPEKFLPERWLASPEEVNEMKRNLIPFSLGPRGCIGRFLAWLEMRLTFAILVRRFTFEPVQGPNMEPVARFILRTADRKMLARVGFRE